MGAEDPATHPRRPDVSELVEIGRGGFGVVYRARQEQFRRDVAVKIISARLDARARARFTQECRALGQLSGHPHILGVYDGGIDPDEHGYLIMLFMPRGSLAERLRLSGPMDWREAVDIGIRLAGALQTAHQAGILHRDLKPANVLVDEYSAPRLADFGQARFVDADVTRSGDITATPAYAAPEVIQGRPATAQADVYSLAATVMALVLGHPPFDSASDESMAPVLFRVLSEPPPDLRGFGVPAQVAAVLETALAKDPAHRQDSALTLGVALQRAQQASGLAVTPLAVAGQPLLLPPGAGQGGPAPSAAPRVGTVPYGRHLPPTGPPAAPRQPGRGRRVAIATLAGLLVLALVVAAVVVVQQVTEPEPAQNLVAADLLLGPDGLLGAGWELDPDNDGYGPLDLFFDSSDLLECLGLPVVPEDGELPGTLVSRDLTLSGSYLSGTTTVQTGGIILSSQDAALQVVGSLRPPGFDLCRDDIESVARSRPPPDSTFGYETETRFAEPSLPELADVVDASATRIVVPLDETDGVSAYTVEFVLVSAGAAVACAGIKAEGDQVDPELRAEVIANLVDALTD